MAVKGTLLFELQNVEYAIPLSYTEAVVSLFKSEIHKVVLDYIDYGNCIVTVEWIDDRVEQAKQP